MSYILFIIFVLLSQEQNNEVVIMCQLVSECIKIVFVPFSLIMNILNKEVLI